MSRRAAWGGRMTGAAGIALIAMAAAGCSHQKQETAIEYMPDMAYQARVGAQHEDPLRPGMSVMRNPVEGTVPRGYTPYRYTPADSLIAQQELQNPLPRTAETLERGQRVYMTTCVVCHGPQGDGHGYIVPPFPMPPTLHSDKVRGWPDGRIFHVISVGQNLMPSYASQILPEDRWAVIDYVRALERSHRPLPSDLAGTAGAADSTGGKP
ncbi:MAG: cytochrome c [Candidatus Eisenbacteria bacterium]|uniref:Cytochrome c n=1 Tax=Eiseniibacteriota bacterium TaxID=2212470 RepID=A0A538TJN2_UNCEI|nr:MAG: cytochrome c [Candidatus Eisenbacteria bacterium]